MVIYLAFFLVVNPLFCTCFDSCHNRVHRNQQNLYPRIPIAIAELLQYSGLRSNSGMGFLHAK